MLTASEWSQLNFGTCDLGDKRRTKRLVQVAEQVASNPSGSLPNQTERWSDLKAAYRLFEMEEVTFAAIARPHWVLTQRSARSRCLVIGDTTEFNFGKDRQIRGIGPTGNGSGQGFLLQNALLVKADSQEILGVAGQAIHYRKRKNKKAKKENASQRMKRDNRESELWGKVIHEVGAPSPDVEYVHVYDRGADNFEVYCHLLHHRCQWVIRAAKLSRNVLVGEHDESKKLKDYLPELKKIGEYSLFLRARPHQPARHAQLEVRVGRVKIPCPRHASPWARQLKQPPIPMNVIDVIEVNPPQGVTPIRWILFTSLPADTFGEAWKVIEYYESRWLVEEYHKAIKSGCDAEACQLKTADRLEAWIGLVSVVAIRLLQLKTLARDKPELLAKHRVPRIWLEMLKLARKNLKSVHDMTIGQFYREVAKLGGFLGRKGDGQPGWITIWRGWEKLNTFVRVASKLKRLDNCG